MSDRRAYLEQRRQECLDKADRAFDPEIAKVHRGFAANYERQLDACQQTVGRMRA